MPFLAAQQAARSPRSPECSAMSTTMYTSALRSLRRLMLAAAPPPRRHLAHAATRSNAQDSAASETHTSARQQLQQQRQRQRLGQPAADGVAASTDAPAPICSTTSAVGQVMAAQANFVRVKVDALEGGEPGEVPPQARLLCVVRALLKKMRREVLVGDRVRLVGIDWTDGRGMVEDVLPRSSQLAEPAVANVDHVLLVFSAALPAFQPSPATRYLLAAEAAWLPVTVAINKADIAAPEEVQAVVEQVKGWGYDALAVSVVSGEGLEQLTSVLRGRVTVVAGPSGAGKSSIINALRMRSCGLESTLGAMAAEASGPATDEGSDAAEGRAQQQQQQHEHWPDASHAAAGAARQHLGVQPPAAGGQQQGQGQAVGSAPSLPAGLELQAVGQVSQRIGRGKHTTRNVTLLELDDSGGSSRGRGDTSSSGSGNGDGSDSGSSSRGAGLVVDTPGFNQPDLTDMPPTELWQHFPEIVRLLEHERCSFRGCQHLQEPGCVVRDAGWQRYPLYCEIHAELKVLETQTISRQASKKRREGSVRMKSRAGGQQGEEVRLESKSHRRVSRRSVKQQLSDLVRDVEEDSKF